MLLMGLQKTTLLDYPGKVACTVFTGGCNFRCPFCHNASLVCDVDTTDRLEEEEFWRFLSKRRGILDGVCVTGGEPLLQKDIFDFLSKIRELGFLIKLDTNGSSPDALRHILNEGLIDALAMDIKNSDEKYALTCGLERMPSGIDESIEMIMRSDLDYEFRTTVVRELHTAEDIEKIAKKIQGAKKYFLQGFIDSGNLIGEGFSAYSATEMQNLLKYAQKYIPHASLRGVQTE